MGSIPADTTPPGLQRIPGDAPYEKIVDALLADGGLIVKNFITQEHVGRMLDILDKKFHPKNHNFKYETPGTFFPQETKVLWSLAGRGPAVGEEICFHPLLVHLRNTLLHMHILRPNDSNTSAMQKPTAEIPPRLSLSVAFDMRPGAAQQPIHRDEDVWGTTHAQPWSRHAIRQIGILIAGTRTTQQNGATLVIPGSHKWNDDRVPQLSECVAAEMEPGDALIFLSSTRHAGGANRVSDPTSAEARRAVFGYFFAKGYLRQEENMLVSIPREVVLGLSERMQRLIGYEASSSHCGFVEFKSPVEMEGGLRGLFERGVDDF